MLGETVTLQGRKWILCIHNKQTNDFFQVEIFESYIFIG